MNDRSYWIDHPTTLHGLHVILHPLNPSHFDELLAAASDKRIWEFYTGDWSVPETFYRIYHGAIIARERGNEYPFVIFHKPTPKIIGSTRLLDIVHYDKRLKIGGTWLMPAYWATAINLDCKLALLKFCFGKLKANRVQLKTQHDNIRSRKAIQKIGGIHEGVIRQHMLKDNGTYRSSAYFSILNEEWYELKERLENELSRIA